MANIKIRLRRNWYTPGGFRIRAHKTRYDEPAEVPEEWRDKLPKDAVIVSDQSSEEAEVEVEEDPAAAFQAALAAQKIAGPGGALNEVAAGQAAQSAAAKRDQKRRSKNKKGGKK
jgi:hypothetical protein|tara:strand:+ start:9859 stop:10203 length:345 start_codon:yes stop_codon:yes gene_type:complete